MSTTSHKVTVPSGNAADTNRVAKTTSEDLDPYRAPAATASLVFGLSSIPFIFFFGLLNFILGITALVLGIVSLCNIGKKPEEVTGKALAIGGIATGILSNVVRIVVTVVIVNGSS